MQDDKETKPANTKDTIHSVIETLEHDLIKSDELTYDPTQNEDDSEEEYWRMMGMFLFE